MIKCSFCEQPLVCRHCRKPFVPRKGESYLGVYQPDTVVPCPECQKVLVCKACGFVYGDVEEEEDKE